MTLKEEREQYAAFMGESPCPAEQEMTQSDIEQSISECRNMLYYAIDHGLTDEIRYWRKMLQEAKVMRRELLAV